METRSATAKICLTTGLHQGNYLPTGLVSVRRQDNKNEMRWLPGGLESKADAKSTGKLRQYLCAVVCNCAHWGPSHRRSIIKHVCVEKQEPYWAKLLTMVGDQWVTNVSTAMNFTAHGSWSALPFPISTTERNKSPHRAKLWLWSETNE